MNVSLINIGEWLLRASWQAGVLAIVILVVQWLAGSRLSARWRDNLWMLVVLRLLLPVVPAAQWSVHNWIALPEKQAATTPAQVQADPGTIVGGRAGSRTGCGSTRCAASHSACSL